MTAWIEKFHALLTLYEKEILQDAFMMSKQLGYAQSSIERGRGLDLGLATSPPGTTRVPANHAWRMLLGPTTLAIGVGETRAKRR